MASYKLKPQVTRNEEEIVGKKIFVEDVVIKGTLSVEGPLLAQVTEKALSVGASSLEVTTKDGLAKLVYDSDSSCWVAGKDDNLQELVTRDSLDLVDSKFAKIEEELSQKLKDTCQKVSLELTNQKDLSDRDIVSSIMVNFDKALQDVKKDTKTKTDVITETLKKELEVNKVGLIDLVKTEVKSSNSTSLELAKAYANDKSSEVLAQITLELSSTKALFESKLVELQKKVITDNQAISIAAESASNSNLLTEIEALKTGIASTYNSILTQCKDELAKIGSQLDAKLQEEVAKLASVQIENSVTAPPVSTGSPVIDMAAIVRGYESADIAQAGLLRSYTDSRLATIGRSLADRIAKLEAK